MDEEYPHSQWSTLNPDFIDKIVHRLKASGRWSKDASSLRALNKHWCLRLNLHFTQAKPHLSRDITSNDIYSLIKFPNLETVDLWKFVTADHPVPFLFSDVRQWWHGLSGGDKVVKLLKTFAELIKLPKLCCLSINTYLHDSSPDFKDDVLIRDYMQMLSRVRYLWIEDPAQSFDSTKLSFLRLLPIEEIKGDACEAEEDLFVQYPRLKAVRLRFNTSFSFSISPRLERVRSLGMVCRGALSLIHLTRLPQLTELRFDQTWVTDIGELKKLTQLQSLAISECSLSDSEALRMSITAFNKMVRLETLELRSPALVRLPEEFFMAISQVKRLRLRKFIFSGPDLLKHVKLLMSLDLEECNLVDESLFWSYLDRPEGTSVERQTLDNLIALRSHNSLNLMAHSFGAMSKLEAIDMGSRKKLWLADFREIEKLRNLKCLTFRCHASKQNQTLIRNRIFLTRLEKLEIQSANVAAWTRLVEQLREQAPWIQITLDSSRSHSPISEYFS